MSREQIDSQLSKFDSGGSRFMTESGLKKYGPGQRDGTSFIMTKQEADALLSKAGGDKRAMEEALGLPKGMLDSEKLVRVDIPKPRDLGLRIPSGNEAGANSLWIPGGKLPTGSLEAVVDIGKSAPGAWKSTPLGF